MRTTRAFVMALALLSPSTPVRAEETTVKSRITGVDLFKNGLVIVKREVTLGKPGTYVLDDVPSPVHGTFWIEAAGPIEAIVKTRDVAVPVGEAGPVDLQQDLAGKSVTIYFKAANRPPVVGTVLKVKPSKDENTSVSPYLLVDTARGRAYIDRSEVSYVEAEGVGDTVMRKRPSLVLTWGGAERAENRVVIRYLTRGMAWAPSYRIDTTDAKTLLLEQHATLRNELSDLESAEVRLISGYPSVEYAHVRSLLGPRTNLELFLAEVGSRGQFYAYPSGISPLTNAPLSQQVGGNLRNSPVEISLGAVPTGEGVDLHFHSIGKRTLAKGEVLALTVAKGKADYERVVEWLVPDSRDEYGRLSEHGRDDVEDAWDALKFKNPLPFPMTTGPATVSSAGDFNGQCTSFWVNAGEETVLRVGKALSLRTRAVEYEVTKADGQRELVWIGGRQYRKTTVEGELAVGNYRKDAVMLYIRKRFTGDLVKAEGNPRVTLRQGGAYLVNKQNELVWSLTLKGGEDRKLKYSYSVLVQN